MNLEKSDGCPGVKVSLNKVILTLLSNGEEIPINILTMLFPPQLQFKKPRNLRFAPHPNATML